MKRPDDNSTNLLAQLDQKASWVRRETLKIHKIAPETRVASSLSDVEIFVALYYGGILNYDPHNPAWDDRDRFVVSKGHGAVSLYPILADRGFFDTGHLAGVCRPDSFLGAIPDVVIPGIETTNGSLGHGLGVACGMSIALSRKKSASSVFVLVGDGELYEGSVWEAVMFAGHHRLSNLILIVDSNRISMLDYCDRILRLAPLEEKFRAFGWEVASVDGHNLPKVYDRLRKLKTEQAQRPKVLVANTVKGKGVPALEQDVLCHIRTLKDEEVTAAIEALQ